MRMMLLTAALIFAVVVGILKAWERRIRRHDWTTDLGLNLQKAGRPIKTDCQYKDGVLQGCTSEDR